LPIDNIQAKAFLCFFPTYKEFTNYHVHLRH
jgi:hypothetical protein